MKKLHTMLSNLQLICNEFSGCVLCGFFQKLNAISETTLDLHLYRIQRNFLEVKQKVEQKDLREIEEMKKEKEEAY